MLGPSDIPELSPEGTACQAHEQRPALVRCPRCRGHVCGLCWFGEHGRCHRCIVAAPEELSGPLPWETSEGSAAARFTKTMQSALSPSRSAPAFATGSTARAFWFFVLTFVPLALLRGVIPYTELVRFGPTFRVTLAEGATARRVALDVARASGLSLLESVAVFIALFACYRSLSAAFGRQGSAQIATRALLYRAFLLPLGAFIPIALTEGVTLIPDGLLLSLGAWFMPERIDIAIVLALLVGVVPAVLTFVSLRAVARLVLGAEPVASFLIAFLPWLLSVFVFGLVHDLLGPLLPVITVQ